MLSACTIGEALIQNDFQKSRYYCHVSRETNNKHNVIIGNVAAITRVRTTFVHVIECSDHNNDVILQIGFCRFWTSSRKSTARRTDTIAVHGRGHTRLYGDDRTAFDWLHPVTTTRYPRGNLIRHLRCW